MKIIVAIFILTLSFTSFHIGAQTLELTSEEAFIVELKEANLRLEEQNKILKTSSVELRDSYYAALSFAATFLILFLGVNVYFFRNRYNEDKKYLQQHVDVTIDTKMTLINDSFIDLESQMEASIKGHITKGVAEQVSPIKQQVRSLQSNVKYQSVDLKRIQIEFEKTPSNKIRLLVALAKDYHSLNWDYQLSDTLVKIRVLLVEGAIFDPSELPDLERFLDLLPKEYNTTLSQIRSYL